MKVDNIIILAAGKGTRMGEVGKQIPKVLWPLFDKRLLEWQVEYARFLYPDAKIHINVFNYKNIILKYINENSMNFRDVNILEEVEELDVGGAIQNIASQLKYSGKLLILNGDQFLFFSNKLENMKLDNCENLMMSYAVNSSDGYNALDIKDGYFKGVIPNKAIDKNKEIVTYTGMSVINLESLKQKLGKSKFFESIISNEINKTKVQKLDDLEYWDFGTLERYINSVQRLKKNNNSNFINFLKGRSVNFEAKLKELKENSFVDFGSLRIYENKVENN